MVSRAVPELLAKYPQVSKRRGPRSEHLISTAEIYRIPYQVQGKFLNTPPENCVLILSSRFRFHDLVTCP